MTDRYRHPIDPPGPHQAAPRLGKLVAQGLLSRDEAYDALCAATDHPSTRTRLAWLLNDTAREWTGRRRKLANHVAGIVRAAREHRLTAAEVFAATAQLNLDAGEPYTAVQIRLVTTDAMRDTLRSARRYA